MTQTHSAGSLQYNLFGEPPDRVVSGRDIRKAREQRKLSVRALAKLAGVDAMTVLRVESGDQTCGSSTMQRISRALGLDESEVELAREAIEPGSKDHLRDVVPWAEDEFSQEIVGMFPDGLTGDHVAEVLSVSPGTVDVAQASAFEKLRRLAEEDSEEGDDVRDWIENVLARRMVREARSAAFDYMGRDRDDEEE